MSTNLKYLPTGINPNKVEELRGTILQNTVTLFLATLENAEKLGLLLGIDQDSRSEAINGLRKRMYSTPDREFVYAVMCEDRDGFANRLFRGLVRDYLGVEATPNGKVKGVQ